MYWVLLYNHRIIGITVKCVLDHLKASTIVEIMHVYVNSKSGLDLRLLVEHYTMIPDLNIIG